jgi:hypothetical protein
MRLSPIFHNRKSTSASQGWLQVALIALIVLSVMAVAGLLLTPRSIQAASLAQGVDPGQLERLKSVLQSLGFSGSEPYSEWSPQVCPNTKGLTTRVNDIGGVPPEQMAPGQQATHLTVYLFPAESEICVPRHFGQEYDAMLNQGDAASGEPWSPQRFTLSGGQDAAVQAYAWQLRKLSNGSSYSYGYTNGIFACGTLFFHVYGAKMGNQPMEDTDNWSGPAWKLAEDQVPRTKQMMEKLAAALQAGNACVIPATPTPTLTPTTTPTVTPTQPAGQLGVGHGCSYNEPGISPEQLRCAATTTNALPNAQIEYAWKLDGVEQAEKGDTFTRNETDITPGTHTLIVVAKDTGNNQTASSSFTFTKPGGAMKVAVMCGVREEDARSVMCYADVTDAPEDAALAYQWTWNGAPEGETGSELSKAGLKDGSYAILVGVLDTNSGKSASPASTTVQVGPPAPLPANPAPQPQANQPQQPSGKPAGSPSGCVPGRDPYVEIVSMDGDISTKTGQGDWNECTLGQKLGSDVEIHAGPESTATLRFPDGATFEVKQLTNMMIGPLLVKADRFKLELLIHLGEIKANVQHRETVRSDFSIRTPTATCGVRGTVFSVRYDEKTGTTTVSVEEGEVLVTPVNTALAPVTLTGGQQVQVNMDSISTPAPVTSGGPGSWSLFTPAQRAIIGVVLCAGMIVLLGLLAAVLIIMRRRRRPA